ncbi:MAG: hypothetical protein IIX28_04740 [Clostridia bacterium]|nr:hypothetical protein [Clostridia bacterium]
MNMRSIFRAVAIIASVALLALAVGCNTPAHQTPADSHEDHNHDTDTPVTESNVHNHDELANMHISYVEETDETFALVIKDCEGTVLLNKTGLTKQPISQQVTDSVIELTWVTSNLPGGFESLYINRKTCQVSDTIVGEQCTDGNRIVYTEVKDGVLRVTVRDLFNKNGYNKITEIPDAYTDGEYTVIAARKRGDYHVNVSYLTDKDGGHLIKLFSLYEADEEKPATTTAKK